MDLTEAEDTKQRQEEHTKELYAKDLNDLDNQDGVVTHLEPDILGCEVKWALRSITMKKLKKKKSITMNKANGGDSVLSVI